MPFPTEWTDALNKLREAGATDALIAGGAMRDFLLGREIKDIDFFMRSRGPEEDKRIAEAVFDDAVLMGQGIPKEYRMQMPELAGVYMSAKGVGDPRDIFGSGSFPAQMVFLNGPDVAPVALLGRFDFGLCRVGFDGERPFYTDDFLRDAFGLTMTLINPIDEAQSLRRYERISAKYPDHRLVRSSMELLAQRDGLEKWSKLIALTDAIERAKQGGELVIRSNGRTHRKYDHYAASEIQHLEQQRKALRATMTLKVVE